MTQRTLNFEQPKAGRATQLAMVRQIMADGIWRASFEVQAIMKTRGLMASESSVTARLRDLRKEKYGGFTVSMKRFPDGNYRYQVA